MQRFEDMAKTRFSILLVTVPLAVMLSGVSARPVLAASTAAEEAVRLLTAAQATDRKCNYLNNAERQELSRYAARAEIAAASQASPRTARSAANSGSAAGRAASCTPDAEADIRETLTAAREAVAAANAEADASRVALRNKPEKPKAAVGSAKKSAQPQTRAPGGLRLYSRVVKAYYLERECLSLSRSEGKRFWAGVARLHREVLSQNGRTAVARVMADAERGAAGSSCGEKVLAQIERGYQEVVSRR